MEHFLGELIGIMLIVGALFGLGAVAIRRVL